MIGTGRKYSLRISEMPDAIELSVSNGADTEHSQPQNSVSKEEQHVHGHVGQCFHLLHVVLAGC